MQVLGWFVSSFHSDANEELVYLALDHELLEPRDQFFGIVLPEIHRRRSHVVQAEEELGEVDRVPVADINELIGFQQIIAPLLKAGLQQPPVGVIGRDNQRRIHPENSWT